MRQTFSYVSLWLLALMVLSHFAQAATLQVAPVTLEMTASQRAAAIYVTNTGNAPIHAQIRVYDWAQSNGKDVLTLTDDVVSSPAMTALAPGQQQLVRVIVLKPSEHRQELSYRLVIDELPGAAVDPASRSGVHFLLRYSIPVFIAGDAAASGDQSQWLACAQAVDKQVWCHNHGVSHIRLSNLQALSNNNQPVESVRGLAGYVLPGQRFVLPLQRSGHYTLHALRAQLNDDSHASQITLTPSADLPTANDRRAR